jgi:hypothetical protein
MELNEKELNFLEEHLPELMGTATKQAFWQTLASGSSVLIAEDGQLLRVFPDGTKEFVKNIEKPQSSMIGEKIML